MRVDDMNPRTGMVVAISSPLLFFGFMFTMSGIKGETLGGIHLIAIGPAICLPGVVAIILANRTNGCTKFPTRRQCLNCLCRKCRRRKQMPRTKESSRVARDSEEPDGDKRTETGYRSGAGADSVSITITTVKESGHLINKVNHNHDEVRRYPASALMAMAGAPNYSIYDSKSYSMDSHCGAYSSKVHRVPQQQRNSFVVYYEGDFSPYGPGHCYTKLRDFMWGIETVV
ncbi:transmembrane protein 215-like [Oncorhynchus clarkii lewisi]|uniref:transmembrane protein 215-like n=1 Tax=Oncorhynchus clarkii lewisi TaxID=490388 RepID=UPI0039B89A00